MMSVLTGLGMSKWGARLFVVAAVASLWYLIHQGATALKQEYDERVALVATLNAEVERLKASEQAFKKAAESNFRSVMEADRHREVALQETRRAQRRLVEKVDEVVTLQRRVQELELLATKKVVQPTEFTTPTLAGGERKVAQDFPYQPPVDLRDVEFNGTLRLLHDEALASCTSPALASQAFGLARRPDNAPLSVQEFVETVVENYCVAVEIKQQLSRAQAWAAKHCTFQIAQPEPLTKETQQ